MPPARVAAVTVAYSSSPEIEAFLESVKQFDDDVEEVVVADNPSPDSERTAEIAAAAGARIVRLPSNRGYGGAVNAAIERLETKPDAFLIANPDVRLHREAVPAMLRALDEEPSIGAVGPKVLNLDGTVYPSAREIPSLRTGLGHAVLSRIWPANPWTRRYRQEALSPDEPRDVGWLSGSCLLVRRTAFESIDGFDERYFMYFEDVDLGYRLGRAGWRNRYEPAAVATHIGGTSTSGLRTRMLRAHHASAYRFLSRKYRGWYLAPLRWTLFFGLRARARWLTRGT
jgi:N-acetylglucosaminyl-diphospho-decaprenol L-rhamnosyltransferase